MSLWQVFRNSQEGNAQIPVHAYIDLTADDAFANLSDGSFTFERWIYGTPSVVVKHEYKLVAPYPSYTSVGWRLTFISTWTPTYGYDSIYPTFSSAGRWDVDGTWWWYQRYANGGVLKTSDYANTWHHIAGISRRIDLTDAIFVCMYLDGVLITLSAFSHFSAILYSDAALPILIGPDVYFPGAPPANYAPQIVGWSRLSSIDRYPYSYPGHPGVFGQQYFTPVPRLSPPASDGDTLGLWYMNEGSGNISYNQQGDSGRDATIYDGDWFPDGVGLNM